MEDCDDRSMEVVKMYGLKKLQMIRKEPKVSTFRRQSVK